MKIKKTIIDLAKTAVVTAEKTLGSNKGKEKKKMAIKYVITNMPLPTFLKPFISILFSTFIDDAIELAVQYMEVL